MDTFAMATRGRAAFVEGHRVHKFDSAGDAVLDEGKSDPESLQIVD